MECRSFLGKLIVSRFIYINFPFVSEKYIKLQKINLELFQVRAALGCDVSVQSSLGEN